MGYWQRFISSFTGQSKQRLPNQMALLGAAPDQVERVRRLPEERQEEAFIAFAEGKHACLLDWKAQRDDVFAGLIPILTVEEKQALPPASACPEDAAGTIRAIRRALASCGRALVQTESLGDFSVLILVPKEKQEAFMRAAGPWLVGEEA